MAIEMTDHRMMREGRRRTLYVLPWAVQDGTGSSTPGHPLVPRFRALSELAKALTMLPIPRLFKNKKLHSEEKKRRQVVESYKVLINKGTASQLAAASALLNAPNDMDKNFLDCSNTNIQKTKGKSGNERWEGAVAMATAPRHWSEQFMKISKTEIAILRTADSMRPMYQIQASSVIFVRPLRAEETPLTGMRGFSFFQVETFARVYYFMVRDKHLNDWLEGLAAQLGEDIVSRSADVNSFSTTSLLESDEAYLAKPACWRLDKRRIFNFRRIIFNPQGIPQYLRSMNPCALVEDMLSKAFSLAYAEANGSAVASQWVAFLDRISVLQTLDFSMLPERERTAFLLNLYHLMVLHGSLIIGSPPSWASWQSFFNTSYLLSFDIVSIAEIEHNMLR